MAASIVGNPGDSGSWFVWGTSSLDLTMRLEGFLDCLDRGEVAVGDDDDVFGKAESCLL
jgi:hypothetical protein